MMENILIKKCYHKQRLKLLFQIN